MRRRLATIGVCAVVLIVAVGGWAEEKKQKPWPLTGTWECTSDGGPRGDMPFTLYLEQSKENVTGLGSSPIGGTDITSSSYKKKPWRSVSTHRRETTS